VVDGFHRTAHYLTSRFPDRDSGLGDVSSGDNLPKSSNPNRFFGMGANDHGFFETAVPGMEPHITSRSERFGLVVGSGRKGQPFLFWKCDDRIKI
jgi:hypothetical protein